ncbi:MAG TPA: molybdopterin converting factor subunit 1 [Thermoplasmata archaeon]|nr:molybdopterin converting factor subunit 1 [Thermoplasmata archaeon]
MHVRVRLFATFREIVGEPRLAWTAKDGATLAALVEAIVARYPDLARHRDGMLLAVNATFASPETVLRDNDEVALMPPVSGGSS